MSFNFIKQKRINLFAFLLLFSITGTMISNVFENSAYKLISYIAEVLLIIYTLRETLKSEPNILFNKYILCGGFILIFNFFISPYEPRISLLLKYFGYICCFGYGFSLAKKKVFPKISNSLLYLIVILPAIVVALFDHTEGKSVFFENSNVFVFLGISLALLYVFLRGGSSKENRIAWCILFLYMGVGTSLGIIVAVCLAFFIINFSFRNLLLLIILLNLFLLAVFYIDLPVLIRFRDVIAVWQSLSWNDMLHLQDLDLYSLGNNVDRVGERSDTTSSIWRLSQWMRLLTEYLSSFLFIPFGLGADYAIAKTSLPPHNDYLLVLTEYGLIVYLLFMKFVFKVYKCITRKEVLYFVLAIFCYYITENLLNSFPQNVILYFILGYSLYGKLKI